MGLLQLLSVLRLVSACLSRRASVDWRCIQAIMLGWKGFGDVDSNSELHGVEKSRALLAVVSFLLVQDLAIQRRENLLNLFSRLFQDVFQSFNILRHSVPFFLRDSPTLCQVNFQTCNELEPYLAGADSDYRGYPKYMGHIPVEAFAVPL